MREFCPTLIDTFHNQIHSSLHLLNILEIQTVNVYQHNAVKVLHLQHKGMLKWIPSKTIFNMQEVFMDKTDMLPNKIYVNIECAITLENKQLSIYELYLYDKILLDSL